MASDVARRSSSTSGIGAFGPPTTATCSSRSLIVARSRRRCCSGRSMTADRHAVPRGAPASDGTLTLLRQRRRPRHRAARPAAERRRPRGIAATSANMSVSSTGTSSGRRSAVAPASAANGTRRTSDRRVAAARSRRRPATRAVWNSIRSRPWKRAYARPTSGRGSSPRCRSRARPWSGPASARGGRCAARRWRRSGRQVALEVLRDEQQVEPECAADAGDRLQLLQLLAAALAGQQLAELVDDDEQARQRRQVGRGGAGPAGRSRRCSPRPRRAGPGAVSTPP